MLKKSFNGSAKTIAASTTITWTGADLPGSRVASYLVNMSGAANALEDILRVKVKATGAPIYDLSGLQLRTFLESTLPSNRGYADGTQTIRIPFMDWLAFDRDPNEAEAQQFPWGETPTVEITFGAAAGAGSAFIGWELSDQRPRFYPRLLSSATGAPGAVAQTNWRVAYTEPGELRGFCIDPTGLSRIRMLANGDELLNLPSAAFFATSGDMFTESCRARGSVVTLTTPVWSLVEAGMPAAPGTSYFELDLTAAVPASSEICIYGRSPQRTV